MFLKIENGKIVNTVYEPRDGYIEVPDDAISMPLVKFYDYVDGKFILDKVAYQRHMNNMMNQIKIEELKKNLSNTDYVVIKIMEGVATEEEYKEVLAKRKEIRSEINRLELEYQE